MPLILIGQLHINKDYPYSDRFVSLHYYSYIYALIKIKKI